jgi:hypothetical protein
MWRGVAVAAVAVAVAGSTFVYARAQSHGFAPAEINRPPDSMRDWARWELSADDVRAFAEARLAALKAGLALTAEQEAHWPAFEQAARELAKLRSEQREARRSTPPAADPAERLRRRATAMADTGAALKKVADAIEPLYRSLDQNQKRRFAMLSRFARAWGMRDFGFDFRGPVNRPDGHRWMMERHLRDGMGRGMDRRRHGMDDDDDRGAGSRRDGRDDGSERL